ncbi:MAG: lysoplasmalogenase family protein [Bacteroidota bacterium]
MFFLHLIRVKENVRGNAWLLLIVVVYYVALIMLLSPYLDDMKLPVRVYGIVISFMFLLAMHMFFIKNKIAGWCDDDRGFIVCDLRFSTGY